MIMSDIESLKKNKIKWLAIGAIALLLVVVAVQVGTNKNKNQSAKDVIVANKEAVVKGQVEKTVAETKDFKDWRLECQSVGDAGARDCRLLQKLMQKDQPSQELLTVVVSMGAQKIPEKNAIASFPVVGFKTPTGVHLPMGVRVRIGDSDKESAVPYQFCGPQACMARTIIDPKNLETMKASKEMIVAYQQVGRKPLLVNASLDGFSQAFDALVAEFSKGKTEVKAAPEGGQVESQAEKTTAE